MQRSVTRRRWLSMGGGVAATAGAWYLRPTTFAAKPELVGAVPDGRWPVRGRDPARTNYAPGGDPPTSDARVAWSQGVDTDPVPTVPFIVGDGIVRTVDGGRIVGFDAENGTQLWTSPPVGANERPPGAPVLSAAGGHVGSEKRVYGLDGGSPAWGYRTPGRVETLLPVGNVLFVSSRATDGDRSWSLDAIDPGAGVGRWRETHDLGAAVAYGDGHLVFEGRELSVADVTGSGLSTPRRGIGGLEGRSSRLTALPTVHDGALFHGRSPVTAVELGSGTIRWRRELGTDRITASAVDGDAVYLTDAYGRAVYALDATDGTTRWTAEVNMLSNHSNGDLAVTDDAVYVAADEDVVVLDPGTGDRIATVKGRQDMGAGSIAAVGRQLIRSTRQGIFALVRP